MSQKELQRVSVISSCIQGDMACARAAALLSLSIRQVKRLKERLREDGEAALAHASRGRPSPRRLPYRVRRSILLLARTTYAASTIITSAKNSARSKASPSAARLCAAYCGRPDSDRHANAALPPIASAVCAPLVKANWSNSTALHTTGSKAAAL